MSRKREYHGMTGTSAHSSWQDMKRRCYNKNRSDYKHYGGRGITVCDEWKNSFKTYFEFVSKLPNYGVDGYTLDRIDNDKGYYPDNVKYSTQSEQLSNRRVYGGSQYRGVSWSKQINKWQSYITINRKRKHLGFFISEIEASKVYQRELKRLIS